MNIEKLTIDANLLNEMVERRLVHKSKHRTFPLYIYNYTSEVQYEKIWNEITIQARGLILDEDNNIVALPFKKFFNHNELKKETFETYRTKPFKVFDKLDGSLGISYVYNNNVYIATRGSFHSEQSVKATEILNTNYKHLIHSMTNEWNHLTFLFEVIYPDNRIIIDYGCLEDIILLGVIDRISGIEVSYEELNNFGFTVVPERQENITDLLSKINSVKDEEGRVIRFNDGFRFKIKFEEYLLLHRAINDLTNNKLWECLYKGINILEKFPNIPDELFSVIQDAQNEFTSQFNEIKKNSMKLMENVNFTDRKSLAKYVMENSSHPHICFAIIDKRTDIDERIWKALKPQNSVKII